MKVVITSIKLKSILKLITFIKLTLKIDNQLIKTNCLAFKKSGFGIKFYTMTLWQNEEDMKDFARSGAHLEAMRQSNSIAKKIKTLTIEAETLPSWKEAKKLLSASKK